MKKACSKVDAWCQECHEYALLDAYGRVESYNEVADDDSPGFTPEMLLEGQEVCVMCGGRMSFEEISGD